MEIDGLKRKREEREEERRGEKIGVNIYTSQIYYND